MADKNKAKLQTTRDFVAISDIRDNVVVLKNGSLRCLVEVNSINFELKSAEEQTAIIQSFQNFINSVDFPIQIIVTSRKLDIAPYLKTLDALSANLKNELLRIQAVEYSRFIKGLTELANIMSKKFYISVPFYPVETATSTAGGFLGALKSVISPSKFAKTLSDEDLENYKIQLNQRIDLIRQGISGLGIESKVLQKDALMNLFYSYYNPGQKLS
jgi:type IV secretory pathway VirB4 component